jgi:pyruvate formate lyase activating enzyme
MGLVFGVERVAESDGPGLRTVFFLKGCRLRCWWCHSPEGQKKQREILFHPSLCDTCAKCLPECSNGAIRVDGGVPFLDRKLCRACGLCIDSCETGAVEMSGWWMQPEEAVERIETDRAELGDAYAGVTLTGGDITLQPEFSKRILRACRERGIHAAIETNGAAPWDVLEPIVALSDLILYDVKHMDSAEHERMTGVPNALILDNLKALVARGSPVEVWMPLVPDRNDTDENLRATFEFVHSLGLRRIGLHTFEVFGREKYEALGRPYWLGHLMPQSDQRLAEILALAGAMGIEGWIVRTAEFTRSVPERA